MNPWRKARTLADLGDLTALWLEGAIDHHPGYCGAPDDETALLVPVLAAANRAGFVTLGSQPGVAGTVGWDDKVWRQRAAVDGFATPDVAADLRGVAEAAGLVMIEHGPARLFTSWSDTVVVTDRCRLSRHGHPLERESVTDFGAHLSRRLVRFQYRGCRRSAVRSLLDAPQVTLIDPAWGPSERLWHALAHVAVNSPMSEVTR